MFNHINKMLRIKEPNLKITGVDHSTYKGEPTIILSAKLSPVASRCQNCGILPFDDEGNAWIVRNGTKKSTIRFEAFSHLPMVMMFVNSGLKLSEKGDFCS